MISYPLLVVLLIAASYTQDLCSSEIYDSYLGVYPMKCDADCEEYKKWVLIMDE